MQEVDVAGLPLRVVHQEDPIPGRNVSLTLYLEACTPQTGPLPDDETWIPLRQAVQGIPYSQDYLSLLARRGRLEAIKRGRNWYTTRKAVRAYMRSVKKSK